MMVLQLREQLDETFPPTLIGKGASVLWPARFLDLNPLDFF